MATDMHTAITIATLMVDYIEIHSQGHFFGSNTIEKNVKRVRFGNSHSPQVE